MSTWFTVLARVAEVDGITNYAYRNALCEFEEGPRNATEGDWRSFYVAFYGDLLENGKTYMIRGNARLPGNDEADAPKFTVTDAIPLLTNYLLVHQLRIQAAVELTRSPHYVDATYTFKFEGIVTGFYFDLAPQALRNDRGFKASQTWTKT